MIIKFHFQDIDDICFVDLIGRNLIEIPEREINFGKTIIQASESFELIDYYRDELIIIDLRSSDLFSKASIDHAINICKDSIISSPETSLNKNKYYLLFGENLSQEELTEMRKHCKTLYYMESEFQEWQIAAMKYFETVIK
jgi:hypothetical protein